MTVYNGIDCRNGSAVAHAAGSMPSLCRDCSEHIALVSMASVNAPALTSEFLTTQWVQTYNRAATTGDPTARALADIYGAELDKRDARACDGFNGPAWSECRDCGQLLNIHPANGTAVIVGYTNV